MRSPQIAGIDPELALGPGTVDATLLLVLWLARKSFFPLIWLGSSIAVIGFGDITDMEDQLRILQDPADAIGSLLSPLGGLVLAFGLRLLANLLALVAAFQLTSWTRSHEYTLGWRFSRWFRSWWDRVYLARAYRSLRWTAVVRQAAHERLGSRGRALRIAEITLFWAGVVFFLGFIVVLGTFPAA